MSLILLGVLKATAILTAALVATTAARRARAAVRHLMLTVAFAALVLLPIAIAVLPDVSIAVPVTSRMVATSLPVLLDDTRVPSSLGTPVGRVRASATASSMTLQTIVVAAWAIGAVIALLPLAAGALELRRIRRQASRFVEGEAWLRDLAIELDVVRRASVAVHPELVGPMTCGVRNPLVIFPPDAREWTVSDVHRAMRHELEHVRRADCLIDGVTRLTCAIYWFHPLVWVCWRRLRLEAERACDDAVLRTSDAVMYADQLVSLAARTSARHAPLMAMANRGDLAQRVTAMLDRRQRRGRAGGASTAAMIAGGLAIVAAIAPVRASWQQRATDAPAFDVASIKENTSGDPFAGGDRQDNRIFPGGRFMARNMTLHELILNAYRWEITRSQLTGVPSWMDQRRFDIDAKAAVDAVLPGDLDVPRAQVIARMIQRLLADRFKLRVTREQRTGDIHVLSVAPGGPRLRPAKDAVCQTKNPGGLTVSDDFSKGCHMFGRIGRTGMVGAAVDSSDITMALRMYLGRPVIDRARLTSLYNVNVHWKPETPLRADRVGTVNTEPQGDENDPDLYTALREQLGLKLAVERGPIEILVVQSAEPPESN